MKEIPLQLAFRLLQDAAVIDLESGVLPKCTLADLENNPQNEFMYLGWQDDGASYRIVFAEEGNARVRISGQIMTLVDIDGDEVDLYLLGPMNLEKAVFELEAGTSSPDPCWSERELAAIQQLSREKDMPAEQVLRQALRLYQLEHHRILEEAEEAKRMRVEFARRVVGGDIVVRVVSDDRMNARPPTADELERIRKRMQGAGVDSYYNTAPKDE